MSLACIKLVSGEELIAIVEEGSNPTEVVLHTPVVIHKTNSPIGPYMQVSHWLLFTKHNKCTIKKQNIVAMEFELEDNAVKHYHEFIEGRGQSLTVGDRDKLFKMLEDLQNMNNNLEDEVFESEHHVEANTTIH